MVQVRIHSHRQPPRNLHVEHPHVRFVFVRLHYLLHLHRRFLHHHRLVLEIVNEHLLNIHRHPHPCRQLLIQTIRVFSSGVRRFVPVVIQVHRL